MRWTATLLAVVGLSFTAAQAAPKHDRKPSYEEKSAWPSHEVAEPSHEAAAGNAFTEAERQLICDYFRVSSCGSASLLAANKGKPKGAIGSREKTALLPPGLDERGELPPGLERQYQRNGKLPPGLQKRQVPDDLLHRLPRRADGFERVIAGNDVLLVQTATGIILDILEGVAAPR